MALLFLQHVARGAVGTPILTSIVEVGVPPSICHLPPGRGVKGVSHGMCLVGLPSVIQAGGYPRLPVRMEVVQPGIWEEGGEGQLCWKSRLFFPFFFYPLVQTELQNTGVGRHRTRHLIKLLVATLILTDTTYRLQTDV